MTFSRTQWLCSALLILVAVLQFNLARRNSLWADEFFSLAIATGHSLEHPAKAARTELGDFVEPAMPVPAARFRQYLQHDTPPASIVRVTRALLLSDTSPPLYYLLLYGWTLLFGTSDLALRMFSVTWSLASVPLIAIIAQRIADRRAAVASCILFAFSPLVLYYSTEGRMYSLLIFMTLATAWMSLNLQERGLRVSYCFLWIALSVAGFLTHYFFIFPWLANIGFLLIQPGKLPRRWLLLCFLLVGLAILPWIWTAGGAFNHWRVTKDWLYWKPKDFQRARALLAQLSQFFSSDSHGLWRTPPRSAALALGLFTLAAAAALLRRRLECFTGKRLLLWLWFFAGCAGPSVIDLVQHTYVSEVPRYALSGVAAACLLGGIVLSYAGRIIGLILLGLILLIWLPGIINLDSERARCSEPVRQIAQLIDKNSNASDLILIHSIPSGVLGVSRYLHTSAPVASWVGQLGNRQVPGSLLTLARDRARILFVRIHDVGQPTTEEDWLRRNAIVVEEKRMQAARLIYFRPKTGSTF